jgi:uncharacterized protein with PQ loop repeat
LNFTINLKQLPWQATQAKVYVREKPGKRQHRGIICYSDAMKLSQFEKFMIVFAVVEPIATIPQILKIWVDSDTSGVSLVTWIFYALTSFIWLAYGITKKDKPLIVSGVLWCASQSLVVIGIIFH